MDLVQLLEIISKSPYSLPTVLFIAVWWAVSNIKQKDVDLKESGQQMKQHYDDDLAKNEKRESWYQRNIEWQQRFLDFNNKQLTDMANDIKDLEALMLEGRLHFESDNRDDEISFDPSSDSGDLSHLRRKLSGNRRNTK